MVDAICRPKARVLDVHDGDTYTMLLDVFRTKFRDRASTAEIRLRDYSCPELETPEGKAARDVAASLLSDAIEIHVELKGQRSMNRVVAWVWIDGQSLGQALVDAGAAKPGARVG